MRCLIYIAAYLILGVIALDLASRRTRFQDPLAVIVVILIWPLLLYWALRAAFFWMKDWVSK